MSTLFISYASDDQAVALEVCAQLEAKVAQLAAAVSGLLGVAELAGATGTTPVATGAPAAPPRAKKKTAAAPAWRRTALIGSIGALAGGLLVGAASYATRSAASSGAGPAVNRFLIPLAPARLPPNPGAQPVAFSPDGRVVAWAGYEGASLRLFVRQLSEDVPVPLVNITTPSVGPVFSPDSRSIAYIDTGRLWKVSVGGGSPLAVAEVQESLGGRGIAWGADGWMVYATTGSGGLMRVRDTGGEPERLTTAQGSHYWPHVVDSHPIVLFTAFGQGAISDNGTIEALDLETREQRTLVRGGAGPKILAAGHLVFRRGTTLLAAPIDLERLEVGEPVPLVDGVAVNSGTGSGFWSISDDGTVVYVPGTGVGDTGTNLVWVDAKGGTVPASSLTRSFADARLSPDGRSAAVEVTTDGDEIWVLDLERGSSTRLTFDPGEDETPAWSPDGRWIAYFATRAGSASSSGSAPTAAAPRRRSGRSAGSMLTWIRGRPMGGRCWSRAT